MNESRCSECNLNWWLFPPVKIDGEPMVRCIECKRTFQDTAERARDDLAAAWEEIGRLKRALKDVRKCYLDSVSFVIMRDEISQIVRAALATGVPDAG